MYRRQGRGQKHHSPQTEVKGQKWSHGTEVTSSHSLLSGAGVHWLAAPPVELTVCAVHQTLQHSDPGFHLGCSGRFSWQPPGRHPQRSLHYEESSRSYWGYTSKQCRLSHLAEHPHWVWQVTKQQQSLPCSYIQDKVTSTDRVWQADPGTTFDRAIHSPAIKSSSTSQEQEIGAKTPSSRNQLRCWATCREVLTEPLLTKTFLLKASITSGASWNHIHWCHWRFDPLCSTKFPRQPQIQHTGFPQWPKQLAVDCRTCSQPQMSKGIQNHSYPHSMFNFFKNQNSSIWIHQVFLWNVARGLISKLPLSQSCHWHARNCYRYCKYVMNLALVKPYYTWTLSLVITNIPLKHILIVTLDKSNLRFCTCFKEQ